MSLQFTYLIHKKYICLQIREINSETTSFSNSATFLHSVREPLKQIKLDFNKGKHIFVCIQIMVTDIGKSRFWDNKSDNILNYQLKLVFDSTKGC